MNSIQSKWQVAFSSPAVWTLIATVIYNGLNANLTLIPPAYSAIVNVALLLLSGYLHSSHVVAAAQLGSTKV